MRGVWEMNVANLNLCKELYQLSGWNDEKELLQEFHHDPNSIVNTAYILPRYSLSYLLDKLTALGITYGHDLGLVYTHDQELKWQAKFHIVPHENFIVDGENATDTVAELAIELFKQGILK